MIDNQEDLEYITRYIKSSKPTEMTPETSELGESTTATGSLFEPSFTPSPVCPDGIFIIKCPASDRTLTLYEGHITLAERSNEGRLGLTESGIEGSVLWKCVERNGWLGFQNPVSGRFLGRDKNGRISCYAEKQKAWENFVTQCLPDGTFILKQEHWGGLSPIGMISEEDGICCLAKMSAWEAKGYPLAFFKVE